MEAPESTERPREVNDRATAIAFVRWCVGQLGLGYHPDTSFADYVDREGRATFPSEEARELDKLQDQAFEKCDPYEIGLAEIQKLVPCLGEDMNDLEKTYAIPDELSKFISDGFLQIADASLAEKTVQLHIPALRQTDDQGRITTYSLTWIHPDHNAQFCHYYEKTPGDLPNFYVTEDTTEVGDDVLDIDSLDDLIAWLDERRSRI